MKEILYYIYDFNLRILRRVIMKKAEPVAGEGGTVDINGTFIKNKWL